MDRPVTAASGILAAVAFCLASVWATRAWPEGRADAFVVLATVAGLLFGIAVALALRDRRRAMFHVEHRHVRVIDPVLEDPESLWREVCMWDVEAFWHEVTSWRSH